MRFTPSLASTVITDETTDIIADHTEIVEEDSLSVIDLDGGNTTSPSFLPTSVSYTLDSFDELPQNEPTTVSVPIDTTVLDNPVQSLSWRPSTELSALSAPTPRAKLNMRPHSTIEVLSSASTSTATNQSPSTSKPLVKEEITRSKLLRRTFQHQNIPQLHTNRTRPPCHQNPIQSAKRAILCLDFLRITTRRTRTQRKRRTIV